MIIASIYPFPFFIGQGHDTNFSLIKDHEIYSCEEGKINQVVHSSCDRFPEKAMLAGFRHFGIEPKDVDHWVFGQPHLTPVQPALEFFFSQFKAGDFQFLNDQGRVHFIEHHLAHASLAVYGSGLQKGAYFTLDQGGDESNPCDSTWGLFDGTRLTKLGQSEHYTRGLVQFHDYICEAVDYLGVVDNGKIMGLAAYGKVNNTLYDELRQLLELSPDKMSVRCTLKRSSQSPPNLHRLDLDSYQRHKVLNTPNPPKQIKELVQYYSGPDVAATGQKVFEDMALVILENFVRKSKQEYLVCSGGAFQNISLNHRLLHLGLKQVYIPCAPNDAGLSLGAAVYLNMTLSHVRPSKHLTPFLGPKFNDTEIKQLLQEYKLEYEYSNDISTETATYISQGKIIGWFQGRSELGPRALGARSVLADPRNSTNKAKVNQLLKRRDWFMPYAPSVLEEQMDNLFKNSISSPYMSFSFSVVDGYKSIPAAVHVDGTSRPSSVDRDSNPKYYDLIMEFHRLTGVPAVLNTSFNRHGIATIVTPRQAIEHLLNGCIDILVIGNFIVFPKKDKFNDLTKIYDEKFYILIETLRPIISAVITDNCNVRLIIANNQEELNSLGITFDINTKTISIHGQQHQLYSDDRKLLRAQLFPTFETVKELIWETHNPA